MKPPEDRRIGPLNLTDKLIDRNDRNTLLVCSSTSKHIPAAAAAATAAMPLLLEGLTPLEWQSRFGDKLL